MLKKIKPDKKVASSEYSVDLFEISKSFEKNAGVKSGYSSIKSALLSPFTKKKVKAENLTTAIQDLTLRIPKGASVGVIGRNGSGKSTLLKLITGIYKPTSGYVKVNGRISALIELGAGFHPDFTGRENLYLGGVLHGLSKKEIEAKFDDIVAFAELEDFIDDPVRTYSSGMFMRLGFSLAIHTDPDVLLVDEVLAVGDAKFVTKCKEKVSELRKQKKTLFLVSHDLSAVERWCDEVIWIDKGVVKDRGEPRRVIDQYLDYIEKGEEEELKEISKKHEEEADSIQEESEKDSSGLGFARWGSREIEVSDIDVLNGDNQSQHVFHTSDALSLTFSYKVNSEYKEPVFGFGINRSDGVSIIGTNTNLESVDINQISSSGKVKVDIASLNLLDGTYYIDVAVHREDGYAYDYHKNVIKIIVHSKNNMIGVVDFNHKWEIK